MPPRKSLERAAPPSHDPDELAEFARFLAAENPHYPEAPGLALATGIKKIAHFCKDCHSGNPEKCARCFIEAFGAAAKTDAEPTES